MDTINQEQQPNSALQQFCSFCLRARLPNVEFYEHIVGSSDDLQGPLQSLLGDDFRLANFTICKPCWKITQLFQDFRLRCVKANKLEEHIGLGLRSEDDWFSERNLTTIEGIRLLLKGQLQQIEKLAQYASEAVLTTDRSVDANKDDTENAPVQEAEETVEEAFESTFDICEIKIETEEVTDETTEQTEEPSGNYEFQSGLEVEDDEMMEPISSRKQAPRIYQCTLCEVQLDRQLKMCEHYKLVHPGQPRHLCLICGRRFNSKSQQQRHEKRVHSGDRPKALSCEQCGKTFAEKWYLTVHMKVHNPEGRPFHCKECGTQFSSKHALEMHLARKHPNLASPTALTYLAKLRQRKQLRYEARERGLSSASDTKWSENESDSE